MTLEYVKVTLKPVYMEQSNERLGKAVLRSFQKKIVDIQDRAIVLTAPTGSGKTVALLTDVKRMRSVGFYPNNELLLSQIAGLHSFIVNYLEMEPIERFLLDYAVKPEESVDVDYAPYNLYESDREVDFFGHKVKKLWILGLSGKLVKRIGERGKLNQLVEAVKELEKHENAYGITVATPDTYFLLALYAYRDFRSVSRVLSTVLSMPSSADAKYVEDVLRMSGLAPREELEKITSVLIPIKGATIFIDEYHLYDLYELSSFKVLMYLLKEVHRWNGRLIFSSATPRIELAKEIAEEADLQLKEIHAIREIRESGDIESLVRGEIELIFFGVDTGRTSNVGKIYGASERAVDLLEEKEVKDFVGSYERGIGRGMVILEKVSHADKFAREMHAKYNIKPICLFPTAPQNFPTTVPEGARDEGPLLIVGTGARIGQGVEFKNVTFGIVARAVSYDYLQSLSRIGRRYPGRSVVLTPIDTGLLNEVKKETKAEMSYEDLVSWIEEVSKVEGKKKRSRRIFLPNRPEDPSIYEHFIKARESLLKLMGLSLFYRLTGTWAEEVRKTLSGVRDVNLRILSSPDEIYGIAMFRSTGPEVEFYRDGVKGSCDLGTLIRNYVMDIDKEGKLILLSEGRGELLARCKHVNILKEIGKNRLTPTLISWPFLQEVFKCEIIDSESHRLNRKYLEEQLFMIVDTNDSDIAEFLATTGRGLLVDLGNEKRTLVLIFV